MTRNLPRTGNSGPTSCRKTCKGLVDATSLEEERFEFLPLTVQSAPRSTPTMSQIKLDDKGVGTIEMLEKEAIVPPRRYSPPSRNGMRFGRMR